MIDLGILAQPVELTAGDLEDGAVGHVPNEPGAVARGERLEPGGRPVHDDPRGRFQSLGDLRRERFESRARCPCASAGSASRLLKTVKSATTGESRRATYGRRKKPGRRLSAMAAVRSGLDLIVRVFGAQQRQYLCH